MRESLKEDSRQEFGLNINQPSIDGSISSAWPSFTQRLALALEILLEDQCLVISVKDSNVCVQWAAQGFFGMRMETTSNCYRQQSDQLSKKQIARLVAMGWHQPTKNPEDSLPKTDPDGSPNFFVDIPQPLDFAAMAGLAVRTFTEVLEISHPAMLEYNAFHDNGNSIVFSELGLKRAINCEDTEQKSDLPELLLRSVRELTGLDDLDFDADGDIGGIRYGNGISYVRIGENGYIRFYSILIKDVKETKALLMRINEMNYEYGHMHLIVKKGVVLALSDVLAKPFIESIIAYALGNFCQVVHDFVGELQTEFGGEASTPQPVLVTH